MGDREIMEKTRKKVSGFTLVEMLVVLAIFGVIMGIVMKVYDISNKSYMVQEEVAAMQQNVRVSKMFIERDVRMAGCGLRDFYNAGGKVYGLVFTNGGTTGSDTLTINYIDYDADPCGSAPGGNPSSCDQIPQVTLTNEMPATATVAVVNEDLTTAPYSAWDDNCYCDGTTYTQPTPGFKMIITTPDGSKSDIVFLTGTIPNSNKLSNGANFTADDGITYDNKVLNTYPAGSTINFFNEDSLVTVVYDLNNNILRRNSQPLAEDIDDLQFAFGLDTNSDDEIDAWVTAADLTNAQKEDVRLVRISVLGRTANGHRDYPGSRQALEDHTAGAGDNYRRKLLQVTVKVRNLGL